MSKADECEYSAIDPYIEINLTTNFLGARLDEILRRYSGKLPENNKSISLNDKKVTNDIQDPCWLNVFTISKAMIPR